MRTLVTVATLALLLTACSNETETSSTTEVNDPIVESAPAVSVATGTRL